MRKSSLGIAVLGIVISLSAHILGGEAQVYQSFRVDAPVDQVVPWILSHQEDLTRAMKFRIVSRDEEKGLVRLVREIRGGHEYEFTVKEISFATADGGGVYDATMVEAHRGAIREGRTYVRVVSDGSTRTFIEIHSKAVIDDPRALDIHVRTGLLVSGKGMERLLQSQFDGG